MDILSDVRSNVRQNDVAVGPTGVRYSYNAVRYDATADTEAYWSCSQFWFPLGEYEMVQNGMLPTGEEWTAELHLIFRTAQHRRTDDLYNMAYRCKRSSATPDDWTAYIDALDAWNSYVSALATDFSTLVPELPQMPA